MTLFYSTIRLLEDYVSADTQIKVCEAILLAQDIREESWNGKSYDKDYIQSAMEACGEKDLNKKWGYIISDFNFFTWNDIQMYAEEFLKEIKGEENEGWICLWCWK